MVNNFHLPPVGFGPGSQPESEEDQELKYMEMPSGMRTFQPNSVYIEEQDRSLLYAGLEALSDIADLCHATAKDGKARRYDLGKLDKANRALISETMGEGEVAVKIATKPAFIAQESVYAGVWQVSSVEDDFIEIAPFPTAGYKYAFESRRPAVGVLAKSNPQVINAPSILSEILDKSTQIQDELHVVNLTLLPHTEEDLVYLDEALGEGAVDILSRGYGNCRVRATGEERVWRVQFFNSMDTLILDTFEVTDMPEVVLAAQEDITDSANRLVEVLEAIR